MLKRTVPLFLLAALALPVAAAAQKLDVKGPLALRGHAFVRGELQATADAKPLRIRLQAGFVRIVDLGSDLKVRCEGRRDEATKTSKNANGQTVYLCVGRALRVGVKGSHYRIFGFAMQYGFMIPDGVTGTLAGRFQQCAAGSDGKPTCAKPTGNQAGGDQSNGQPPADQSSDSSDDGSSDLAQLDAFVAANPIDG